MLDDKDMVYIERLKQNEDFQHIINKVLHDMKAPIANLEGLLGILNNQEAISGDQKMSGITQRMDISVVKLKEILNQLKEL